MSSPVARFTPARHYFPSGIAAILFAVFSAWSGLRWWAAFIPSVLFVATAAFLFYMALRPAIEIHEHWLRVGNEMIPWTDIRRLDRGRWASPLIFYLTLLDERRIRVIFPGDADSTTGLVRFMRRNSRDALIDGVPYRQFWGEVMPASKEKRLPAPKYRVVRQEDEDEIERMFQRLKSVGHIDPKQSDEK